MPRFSIVFAISLVCLQAICSNQSGTSVDARPYRREVSNRIVAVGDLHSDYTNTLAVLRLASIIDTNNNWAAGSDTLVQTGDIPDRGPGTIAIYQLFQKLREQAKSAGGEVINLYGNHEVMNIGGDLRYVTQEDIDSFGGLEKRKAAWDIRTGWLGQFIFNNFNITHIQHGHTAFSHADMHPDWARIGADGLNQLAHQALWDGQYKAPIFTTYGPVWNRALANQDEGSNQTCETIETVKQLLGVNRLVSGHTAQSKTGKILSLCGGSYLGIDVGIANYYGGHLAALEIIENSDGTQTVNELYPRTNGKGIKRAIVPSSN
ncbi:hypothetical protein BGZ76_009007 [Entomortierella beljakovae]|nr:hypothetical protein BGZ76_009007 [Entomortierella beljakovae]